MISVAILAGGKSTRMGRDKAFLEVGGKMVVERVIERVQPLTDDLFVNTNTHGPLFVLLTGTAKRR